MDMKKFLKWFGIGSIVSIAIFIVVILLALLMMFSEENDCSSNSNDIAFTDSPDMTKNAQMMYDYMVSHDHATPEGAAGALGTWEFESRFNPKVANGSGSGATGLVQWMGGRLTNLRTWCNSNGKDPDTLNGQVAFAMYEMKKSYPESYKAVTTSHDVGDVVETVTKNYEGLSQSPAQWKFEQRKPMANHWYALFGTSDPASSSALDNASDTESENIGDSDCSDDGSSDNNIVKTAQKMLGYFYYVQSHPSSDLGSDLKNPNRSGGTDCSGFVWLTLNKAGYKVPANMAWFTGSMASDAKGAHKYLKQINPSDANAGDIVIVNQGSGAGNNGHTAILLGKWQGKDTKIIEEGGDLTGHVNESTFGTSFSTLLDGGDVVLARPNSKDKED